MWVELARTREVTEYKVIYGAYIQSGQPYMLVLSIEVIFMGL
jgi:hypothetical protein